MDLVAHDGVRELLVDVTVVSPLAGGVDFVAACARRDGHAARRAAIAKRQKYDSPDLIPFAIETGGRLGEDARALLKRLAAEGDDPEKELISLYKAISTTIQSGVARQLLGR